jgi:uncharacterized delta-60 repeat protein
MAKFKPDSNRADCTRRYPASAFPVWSASIDRLVAVQYTHIFARAAHWLLSMIALAYLVLLLAGIPSSALAAAGDLDTSFNGTGIVTTSRGYYDYPMAAVVQADGKIIMVGSGGIMMTRYHANGTLDEDFGEQGLVSTSFGQINFASAIAVQPDGKIVVAGPALVAFGYPYVYTVVRYLPNGTVDTSFGDQGGVVIPVSGNIRDIALQSDGKIVIAGYLSATSWGHVNISDFEPDVNNFVLVRLNTDGSLDTGFGVNGIVLSIIGVAESVAVLPDGNIIAAGSSTLSPFSEFVVARFLADGSSDKDFGTNGLVKTAIGMSALAYTLTPQPDGKVIVAGASSDGQNNYFALARYDTHGALDPVFGTNGIVTNPVGALGDQGQSLALQQDGKILLAGNVGTVWADGIVNTARQHTFALVRYNANGTLDTTFGDEGKVITPIGPGENHVYAAIIQTDGNILIAGTSEAHGLALVRYLSGPGPVAQTLKFTGGMERQ